MLVAVRGFFLSRGWSQDTQKCVCVCVCVCVCTRYMHIYTVFLPTTKHLS